MGTLGCWRKRTRNTVPVEDVITTEVLVEVLSPKQSVLVKTVHIQYVLLEFTDVTPENVLDVTDVHHMLMDITWVTSVQLVVVEEKANTDWSNLCHSTMSCCVQPGSYNSDFGMNAHCFWIQWSLELSLWTIRYTNLFWWCSIYWSR